MGKNEQKENLQNLYRQRSQRKLKKKDKSGNNKNLGMCNTGHMVKDLI